MKIEDCKTRMKVTSKTNPCVRFYEIYKVCKNTIWVTPVGERGNIYKGINPSIFEPYEEEE